MSRKSRAELNNTIKKRIQLKWEVVRLNPIVRAFIDAHHSNNQKDQEKVAEQLELPQNDSLNVFLGNLCWFPHYSERNLDAALKKAYPNISKQVIRLAWEDWAENGFGGNPDHIKVNFTTLHSPTGKLPQCEISFSPFATKEQVKNEIDKAFTKFDTMQNCRNKRVDKPKYGSLQVSLLVYEKKHYRNKSLRQISNELLRSNGERIYGEVEAYNTVKSRYKNAKKFIEQGGVEVIF